MTISLDGLLVAPGWNAPHLGDSSIKNWLLSFWASSFFSFLVTDSLSGVITTKATLGNGDKLQTGMGFPVRWLVIDRECVDDRESSSCIDDNRNTQSGCVNKVLCQDSNLL